MSPSLVAGIHARQVEGVIRLLVVGVVTRRMMTKETEIRRIRRRLVRRRIREGRPLPLPIVGS